MISRIAPDCFVFGFLGGTPPGGEKVEEQKHKTQKTIKNTALFGDTPPPESLPKHPVEYGGGLRGGFRWGLGWFPGGLPSKPELCYVLKFRRIPFCTPCASIRIALSLQPLPPSLPPVGEGEGVRRRAPTGTRGRGLPYRPYQLPYRRVGEGRRSRRRSGSPYRPIDSQVESIGRSRKSGTHPGFCCGLGFMFFLFFVWGPRGGGGHFHPSP